MAAIFTASPPHASAAFDLATLLSAPNSKREDTLTMADALFSLPPSAPVPSHASVPAPAPAPASVPASGTAPAPAPGPVHPHAAHLDRYAACPPDGPSPLSEQSLASSPVSFASSERAASVPGDADSLTTWFSPVTASAMMSIPDDLAAGLDAFAFAPPPAPSMPTPSSQATLIPPLCRSKQDNDFDTACTNLRGMAASGLPASSMLQYLHASRNGIDRDIPAEVLLQGLIEFERTQLWDASSPSASSQDSSFGPQRRARRPQEPDASVASYAIPAGPRMYKCDKCPLVFDRAYNLREHLKTHDPNCVKEFECPLNHCPHASHRRADMHRHIKNVHIKKEALTPEHKSLILASYPAMRGDFAPTSRKRGAKPQ